MRTNELRDRIERLENTLFMIEMKDRWTAKDYEMVDKIEREIEEIKKNL